MPGVSTRWEPFAELGELRSRFDRLFGELGGIGGGEGTWTPAIDVVCDNGNLVLCVDVPGIKPKEVRVEVEDDILTVSGEHEEREKDEDYLCRERRYGSFSRSLALPAGVEAKKIKARTHEGVIEVTIPLPKEPERKRIQIKPSTA
ncbi:MAG TPA: HSP20 family small heat-shock protein [Solirubrobacteraceae bacterium]|nr:HSP20 family small heat-shock protein [Solirubrobacteraceae bacterium]